MKKETLIEINRQKAWREVCATSAGRQVLGEIMQYGRIFDGNREIEPAVIAHREGAREVSLYVFENIKLFSPQSFITILQENNKDIQETIQKE